MPITLIHSSSDPTNLLLLCALGFGIGIALFVYGFRLLQRRRLILDTPFSKIRSASLGMVEISGLATGPYTMLAPITQRPCYYYRTLVWEWKQSGKDHSWVKVAAESMHLPFFLDDNTGRVLVDPRGADLDLHRDFEEQFQDSFFSTKELPENVRGFLTRHGVVTSNRIKVEEYCIKPKNSLFLLGTLAENPGIAISRNPMYEPASLIETSSGNYSLTLNSVSFSPSPAGTYHIGRVEQLDRCVEIPSDPSPPEIIHLSQARTTTKSSEMTQQQRIAAALLKAGISSPAAWAAAGISQAPNGVQLMAEAPVTTPSIEDGGSSQSNAFDPPPAVVLMKGENNPTFLISWRSQQEIARSLGWKCSLMIWGGPALALLSLYFLLAIKHLLE